MDFRQVLGTSSRRRLKLMELLYYHRNGAPSEKLMNDLSCSLPVFLNDINLINEEQDHYFIEKTKGLYRISPSNDMNIGKLYADALTNSLEFQILEQLLYERCESIEALSKALFLSASNTQRFLKKLEQSLKLIGIQLLYRPLRLVGKESVIRHLYYRYFIEKQYSLRTILPDLKEYQVKSIESFVLEFTKINGLELKYVFQRRVTYNVFISLWRIANDHNYPQKELRKTGLLLPKRETISDFRDTVSEYFRFDLTDEVLRDCLWLSFSDAIVFSKQHRTAALEDNNRYRELFTIHLNLAQQFADLMGNHFTEERLFELTTVLVNEVYLFDEDQDFLLILRKSRPALLEMLKIMHWYAVEKVTEVVKRFAQESKIYQTDDFISNYVYLLLTAEVDSLEQLAAQDQRIHLLLISDLSPTEERFIANSLLQDVYGNFEIHHIEGLWEEGKDRSV